MHKWGRFGSEKEFLSYITKNTKKDELEKRTSDLEKVTKELKETVAELEKALKEKEAAPE